MDEDVGWSYKHNVLSGDLPMKCPERLTIRIFAAEQGLSAASVLYLTMIPFRHRPSGLMAAVSSNRHYRTYKRRWPGVFNLPKKILTKVIPLPQDYN